MYDLVLDRKEPSVGPKEKVGIYNIWFVLIQKTSVISPDLVHSARPTADGPIVVKKIRRECEQQQAARIQLQIYESTLYTIDAGPRGGQQL